MSLCICIPHLIDSLHTNSMTYDLFVDSFSNTPETKTQIKSWCKWETFEQAS